MRCPNSECGATVGEGDDLGSEALAQASHSGRVRKLANASLILAILSCPLSWIPLTFALIHLLRWVLPSEGLPSQGEVTYGAFLAYLGTGLIVLFMALSAIVTGHIAIARGRRVPGTGRVFWRALFGTLLGYLNVVVPIMLVAFAYFSKGRPNQDMAVCQGNLRAMQSVFREYREEHAGMFPPLSSQPGVLMFSAEAITPKDNTDPLPLTCPTIRYAKKRTQGLEASNKPAPPYDDQSYFYIGYAVLNDDDVEAFAQAYRRQISEGGTFDKDLVVKDGEEAFVFHRLSEGVKDVLRADQDRRWVSPHEGRETGYQQPCVVTTDVPVLIERDMRHVYADCDGRPRGALVLYLNAGVQFVEHGTWPMTEKTQRILAELAE